MSSEVNALLENLVALPAELDLEPPRRAISGSKVQVKIPSNIQTAQLGDTIKFQIPSGNSSFWLGSQTMIQFDVKADTSQTASSIGEYVTSLFSMLRLMNGTTEIMRINEYGLFESMYYEMNAEDSMVNTVLDATAGAGTSVRRIAHHTALATRRYCVHLVGLKSVLKEAVPLFVGGAWSVELALDTNSKKVSECDAVANEYKNFTLSNIDLVTHVLRVDSSVDASLRRQYENRQVLMAFTSYDHYKANLPSASTSNNVIISSKKSSISGIHGGFRRTAQVNDPEFQNKMTGIYESLGGLQWQFQVNGVSTPCDPVAGGIESYCELLRYTGHLGDESGSLQVDDITYNLATVTKVAPPGVQAKAQAFVAYDMKNFESDLISGQSTSGQGSSIIYKMTHNALAAAYDADFFVRYNGLMVFNNGTVRKVD